MRIVAATLTALLCWQTAVAGEISLELPQVGSARYTEGVVQVLAPQSIKKAYIHIPGSGNAKVYTKINALGVGTIQSLRAKKDELLTVLDLSMHAGKYALEAGANTIEVKVVPRDGSETLYSRWAIVAPKPKAVAVTPIIRRAVITPGTIAERLKMEPLELKVSGADGGSQLLTSQVTDAERLIVSGSLSGSTAATKVRIQRAGAGVGGGGTRGLGITVKSDFRETVDLVSGANDFEIVIFEGEVPQVTYGITVIRSNDQAPPSLEGRKWAVVIGISDYLNDSMGITDLDYADDDALAFRDFLLSSKGGSFSTSQISVLVNEQATAQNIRTAFFNFLAKSQPEDLVIIFFAGHGSPDPVNPDNHYLLAYDTDPSNMGGTAVPMWDLRNVLDFTIKAKTAIVFADACHSGSAVQSSVKAYQSELNFVNKYLESLAREGGRMVVTAAQADEFSFEDSKWGGGHGIFTHTLLTGLKGDADYDGNGTVTVAEALDYIEKTIPKQTEDRQHPSYRKSEVNPTLPLGQLVSD
jgi:hypothetical protein|tara:strand:- start:3576 stop:5153 length:1578 start_codon:yes stop_codon:yes gene_type:complete